jgi:hypothetical protein
MLDGGGGGSSLYDLAQAAIDAELQHEGWALESAGHVRRAITGEYGNSFSVRLDTRTGAVDAGTLSSADAMIAQVYIDKASGVMQKWGPLIDDAFAKWIDLPSSSANLGERAALTHAVHELNIQGTSPNSQQDAVGATNARLSGDIENLNDRSGKLRGRYAEAFKEKYVSRLDLAIQNQCALVSSLSVAAEAQSRLWASIADDVSAIQEKAVKAMQSSGQGGGSGIGVFLTVVGAIAGAVAAVPTLGSSVAAGLAIGGTVIGTAGGLAGSGAAPKKQVELGGSHPDIVFGNVKQALEDLNTSLTSQEQGLADFLAAVASMASGAKSGFDIVAPSARPGQVLDGQQELSVDPRMIAKITRLWIPSISGDLRSARSELTVGSGGFERTTDIGLAPNGAWQKFSELQDRTVELLSNTAQELDDGAEILESAARDIGLVDEEANRAASREADRIVQVDA